jgi:hypothetical protein
MNELKTEQRVAVVKALCEGVSIRGTVRLTEVAKEAVERAFGSAVDYAMLVKIYGGLSEEEQRKYSPATSAASAMSSWGCPTSNTFQGRSPSGRTSHRVAAGRA